MPDDTAQPTLLRAVELLVDALEVDDRARVAAWMRERYDANGYAVVGFVDRKR